jgi:para-nitrobenzyl esterase
VAEDEVQSFKGIPYAAPPVGDRRWRPPVSPAPWSQPREATDFGSSCPQPAAPSRVPPGSRSAETSEDCLTLNVWAPVAHPKPLPVMVWIHGGGNVEGSSADTYYDGGVFAKDGVVLVSFNYRLGWLGFFEHPALSREAGSGSKGNYGLLDQLAALQWVQRNIAAFGGDSRNVTLFGESAGGEDVLMLMTMPSSAGLFARAIVESAGFFDSWQRLPDAEAIGAKLATSVGLSGASASTADLRAVPVATLMAQSDVLASRPAIDGRSLVESPIAAFAAGRSLAVPLVIGSNGNEGSLLGDQPDTKRWIEDGLMTSEQVAALRLLYGQRTPDEATFTRQLFRDAFFAAPARWFAARQSSRAPSYVYRFDYVLSLLRTRRTGADHGSEVPYVFATWNTPRLSTGDLHVTTAMHGCWVSFATTGTPVCPGAPAWPAYSAAKDESMRFADPIAVAPIDDAPMLDRLADGLIKRDGR